MREQLIATGWKQGSIIRLNNLEGDPIPLASRLDWPADAFGKKGDWIAVLVSQTCDILSDAESQVEVLIAQVRHGSRPADAMKTRGRHPRQIRFHVVDSSSDSGPEMKVARGNICARAWISRDELQELEPAEDLTLPDEDRKILRAWLVARYTRVALPDSLEERMKSHPGGQTIHKVFEEIGQNHDPLWRIYLSFEPLGEASEYTVEIVGVAQHATEQGAAQQYANAIAGFFNECPDVEADSRAVLAHHLSLAEAENYIRFDRFDFFSLEESSATQPDENSIVENSGTDTQSASFNPTSSP